MNKRTPDIEPIKDADFGFGFWPWSRGPMWELQEAWSFTVDNSGFKAEYLIPAGYQFDKASVPSFFWSLGYTPDGLCTVPALEHDYLCDIYSGGSGWLHEKLGKIPAAPPAQVIHRHFYNQLVAWGMRSSKARVMWEGVRNFGPGGRMRPSSWFKRAAILACFFILPSCTLPASSMKRIAVAGGVGYLTGGQAGAITAAAAEIQRTSAKNPVQP